MSRLLAIETATDACSVALMDGERVWREHAVSPRKHAELVLAQVDVLLGAAGLELEALDAIVFGRGPGSFTGVRVAASVVQGLALGAGLAVVPVSTLAVIAQGIAREHGASRIAVALDARMDEVYFGAFEVCGETVIAVADERVGPAAELALDGDGWYAAGSGWQHYADKLPEAVTSVLEALDARALPDAADALVLGETLLNAGAAITAAAVEPVYLRNRVTR